MQQVSYLWYYSVLCLASRTVQREHCGLDWFSIPSKVRDRTTDHSHSPPHAPYRHATGGSSTWFVLTARNHACIIYITTAFQQLSHSVQPNTATVTRSEACRSVRPATKRLETLHITCTNVCDCLHHFHCCTI
jgi:hypothetical protein